MTGCREMRARIPAAVEGELAIEALLALEAHCAACSACARRYGPLRALEEALARLPDPAVERLDVARAVARVSAEIDRRLAAGERGADPAPVGIAESEDDDVARPAELAPVRRGRRASRLVAIAAAGVAVATVVVLALVRERPVERIAGSREPAPIVGDERAGDRPPSEVGSRPVEQDGAPRLADEPREIAADGGARADGEAPRGIESRERARDAAPDLAVDSSTDGEPDFAGDRAHDAARGLAAVDRARDPASEAAIDDASDPASGGAFDLAVEHAPDRRRELAVDLAPDRPIERVESRPSESTSTIEASDPIDLERLARARREVREHLLASFAGRDADPRAAVIDFETRTAELARGGWPIVRLVDGALADDDVEVARAALRYLGRRGDRLALARVRAALARRELASDVVRALADAGDAGLEGLESALGDPAAGELARAALVRRGDAAAARAIERSLAGAARTASGRAGAEAALFDALAAIGAPGVECLLVLGSDARFAERALGALERIPAARDALDAELAREPGARETSARETSARAPAARDVRATDARFLVRATARLKPAGAVPALLARARDRELRDEALAALAALATPESLRALLALRTEGAIAPRTVDGALRAAIAAAPDAARALAAEVVAAEDERAIARLDAALTADPVPSSTPALIELARSRVLASAERRTALLVAGEIGSRADVEALVALYAGLRAGEADLRAAALLALDALGGAEAVERALAAAPERVRARVLALLAARTAGSRPTTTLLRLAREIEPELDYASP